MASSLSNSAAGFSQLSSLTQLSSILGRMSKNTANAGN